MCDRSTKQRSLQLQSKVKWYDMKEELSWSNNGSPNTEFKDRKQNKSHPLLPLSVLAPSAYMWVNTSRAANQGARMLIILMWNLLAICT